MNWNDIAEKQAADYRQFLESYKEAREKVASDKAMLLKMGNCTEATASPEVLDKIARDADGFQKEWGMFSQQFKNMRIAHQKELDTFFKQQELAKDLSADKTKDKAKTRDGGR